MARFAHSRIIHNPGQSVTQFLLSLGAQSRRSRGEGFQAIRDGFGNFPGNGTSFRARIARKMLIVQMLGGIQCLLRG